MLGRNDGKMREELNERIYHRGLGEIERADIRRVLRRQASRVKSKRD